ncbi:YncE family protein [Longimicrobium terrae]|uniref:DNA-binding beta-propeller fold protein YncE n=1 Tax=Longimicrobium terrae TaxID=1639882 RepID=A0A841GUD9_9BACT|nr:hypothetical protein [Longimicrobium terrae]MBB4634142.1 DNA-binding beta-propeller fold protein YncE [Longimicrobium terrae]MBB6068968.1 DNA-binding beta-propeller fold protein YncE [Longimicrobium terrae]NNC28147.1 hypothetical protein [Longimicrobium terrae]
MRRPAPARARAAALVLALLAAAACREPDTVEGVRTIALPDSMPDGATLAVDSARRAWVGRPGRLTAYDTAGRPVAEIVLGGRDIPRVLAVGNGRVMMAVGRTVARADARGGKAVRGWSASGTRVVALDPRGAWAFAANRQGGVVGLDAATLRPAWGWPEAGGEAVGMAVSPLGDRVYVSVAAAGEAPAAVRVHDAASGRILFATDQPVPLRGLTAAEDGSLFGVADGRVVRLRHERDGLPRLWAQAPRVAGDSDEVRLRVNPAGTRVAVFGRGRGARMVVLDAATGEVVDRMQEAPLDAAYGVEGRLYLLDRRGLKVLP